jgi:CBS domain containing-hemolysin-like protein
MTAIDIEDDIEDILDMIDGTPYSRLPVYETESTISSAFYISTTF